MRLARLLLLLAACRTPLPAIEPEPMPAPDGREPLLGGRPLSERLASYSIAATLDVAARRLIARQTLVWRHTGTGTIAEIPLHLYMNGFKNEATLFMRTIGGRVSQGGAIPAGGWGWIEVESIRTAAGAELRPAARHGEDESILLVPLPQPMGPGEVLSAGKRSQPAIPSSLGSVSPFRGGGS